MKRYFLDLSGLTQEDFEIIKKYGRDFNLRFDEVLYEYAKQHPGKIKVLGIMENGVAHVDEITENGVKEYNGKDAMRKILEQVRKNKEEKDKWNIMIKFVL